MVGGIHRRERGEKQFFAKDPEKMGAFEKMGKLLDRDIDLIKEGKLPGLTYDEKELRRSIWKKGR